MSTVVGDCRLHWDRMNQIIGEKVKGKAINDNVVIEEIVLSADTEWIYAVTTVSGKVSAKIKSQFKLQPGNEEHPIQIAAFEADVEKGGLLTRGAEWFIKTFMGQKFRDSMIDRFQEDVDRIVEEAVKEYSELNNAKGLKVRIDMSTHVVEAVEWDEEKLLLRLRIEGTVRLDL